MAHVQWHLNLKFTVGFPVEAIELSYYTRSYWVDKKLIINDLRIFDFRLALHFANSVKLSIF